MPASSRFSCRCGKVTGTLSGINPAEGTHVVCHCNACRLTMERAGMGDMAADGVDLFQTTPDRITIETGMELLKPLQKSPNGILRWHATCCNTPLVNTLKTPSMPFAGILVCNLEDASPLGPVIAHGFVTGEDGKQRHENGTAVIGRLLKRAAKAKLTGRGKKTPFFGADGKPVAEPQLMAKM